eukprot:COSAG01_NODE_13533_length_1571_cov_1.729620_1_plen_224_part_10
MATAFCVPGWLAGWLAAAAATVVTDDVGLAQAPTVTYRGAHNISIAVRPSPPAAAAAAHPPVAPPARLLRRRALRSPATHGAADTHRASPPPPPFLVPAARRPDPSCSLGLSVSACGGGGGLGAEQVDTPAGLIVPNIKMVQTKSVLEVAAEIERLATLGRNGQLQASAHAHTHAAAAAPTRPPVRVHAAAATAILARMHRRGHTLLEAPCSPFTCGCQRLRPP